MDEPTSHVPPLVGVIGLGNMGAAIGRALHRASLELVVYDIRAEALEWFTSAGIRCAESLADVADCDIVAVILNNDAQVIELADELLPQLRSGTTLVVHSTVSPETMRATEKLAAGFGVEVLDTPVSGGAPAADRSALTVMVGGTPIAVARCMPELAALGPVHHLGGLGSGQTVKIINDLMQATSWIMALKSMEIARAQGVSEPSLVEIASVSTGASWTIENLAFCDDLLLTHTLASDRDQLMSYMSKDVSAALALARGAGLSVPFVATVAETMPVVLSERLAYLQSHREGAAR